MSGDWWLEHLILVIVLGRKNLIDLQDKFGGVIGKHLGILGNLVFA